MVKLSRFLTTIIIIAALSLVLASGLIISSQSSAPNNIVMINMLSGINVPIVFQGDNNSIPISFWPTYYGTSKASNYWSAGGISSNQPVLELTPAQRQTSGSMFWQEYYLGGNVAISLLGTYSKGLSPVGDGFAIYLFIKTAIWGIEPQNNYSIPYTATALVHNYSPVSGDVMLPQSSTPYILVEWDPYWQFGNTSSGATGQWNVWIVTNTNGSNPSIIPKPSPTLGSSRSGWDGIGTGSFQPKPGDIINITVTYNSVDNTLNGRAYDINTGQFASFTLSLGNYFMPLSSGYYIFGTDAINGDSYANWALIYVDTKGLSNIVPVTLTSTQTVITTNTVTQTAIIMSTITSITTTAMTVTSTTSLTSITTIITISNVPITTTVTSTVTQTINASLTLFAMLAVIVILAVVFVITLIIAFRKR